MLTSPSETPPTCPDIRCPLIAMSITPTPLRPAVLTPVRFYWSNTFGLSPSPRACSSLVRASWLQQPTEEGAREGSPSRKIFAERQQAESWRDPRFRLFL